jgi:hypothetical protein
VPPVSGLGSFERERKKWGASMNRPTLYFRLSLVWLVILAGIALFLLLG